MKSRWKVVCAYDGGRFNGWQSQPDKGSVQDAIEGRLERILGLPTRIHGSGRTDAGVHALAQVFHFDGDWVHGPLKLAAALRHGLAPGIQIVSVRGVPDGFHARFCALGKVYRYQVFIGDPDPFLRPLCWAVPGPLDSQRMEEAASCLQGRHDFRAFSASRGGDEEGGGMGTVRDLRRLTVSRTGRRVRITAEADGFLYRMVRRLVGAVVGAGQGRLDSADLRRLLKSGERNAEIQTAPAHGLFLMQVHYK